MQFQFRNICKFELFCKRNTACSGIYVRVFDRNVEEILPGLLSKEDRRAEL